MSHPLHISFENVAYPCYLLEHSGGFLYNAAAKKQTVLDSDAVRDLLTTLARQHAKNPTEPLPSVPLPPDALRPLGLSVVPVEEGLLAFMLQPQEPPINIFTAHLRDPLADIFAVLPMVAKKLEDEDLHLAEDIQINCYRLLRTMFNLENMGRSQNRSFTPSAVDLCALVSSVCDSAATLCREQGVPIKWTVPAHAQPVLCDSRLVSEALMNLLRNALQYTRDGNQIHTKLTTTTARVVLTVEDKGLGIRAENLEKIFRPYFSIDPYGESGERPGLGLGLAVVQETARSFGGTVVAESRFGEGTRISLSFPVNDEAHEVMGSASTDYLLNRYSSAYVQLCGYCLLPGI